MSDAFLGEDRARAIGDPTTGLADAVFSLNVVARRWKRSWPSVGLVWSSIRLMVLGLVLFLPETVTAATIAVKEQAQPQVDVSRHYHYSAPVTGSAKIRPHRRLNFISHFSKSRLGSPNDDAATDNSSDDDDDVWEELNANESSNEFLIAWFPGFAPCFTPVQARHQSGGTARSTSAFLPPHRLRC